MSDALARKVDRLSSLSLRVVGSVATLKEDVARLRADMATYNRKVAELRETLTTMPRRDAAPGG